MEPKIVTLPEMMIVGSVACGVGLKDINISELWEKFLRSSKHIKHQVGENGYEVHIADDTEPKRHYCITGVEVDRIEDLPMELFVKVLPAGQYTVYTHRFKDGGFGEGFKNIYQWLRQSPYTPAYSFDIQCYDHRFKGPTHPDSEIDILVPVKLK